MNKKQKKSLTRIIIAAVILVILMIDESVNRKNILVPFYFKLAIYLIPYLTVGYDVIKKAVKNICHGQVFDENFLMLVATVAAFCVKEFNEAVAVMLFYSVGELFQSVALGKSRKSISDMLDIVPEYAVLEKDGETFETAPENVSVGDIIVIRPGERIPLDGIVTEGESFLDTAALTGESVPRRVEIGSEVFSGCINGTNTLKVKVTKEYENSTATKIIELVENASSKKAKTENYITKFAKYYTPAVTVSAIIIAVFPIVLGFSPAVWIRRACVFLVISCPCALVISVPLGFFGGIGAASEKGILIKGSNYFEALANLKSVVFDKTGTLTKGEFTVSKVLPNNIGEDVLLKIAATAEWYSNHPIAESIKKSVKGQLPIEDIKSTEQIPGRGFKAVIGKWDVLVGNDRLMTESGIDFQKNSDYGTAVYVAANGEFLGTVIISDTIKPEAEKTIRNLKNQGIERCIILTGDRKISADAVAKELGADEVYSELLPEGKVEILENILQNQAITDKTAFVGDGMNDAPALSRADVGIAMGGMGSDAAIEAADIVIMDDNIEKIPTALKIARKTIGIIKENIAFALFVKFAVLILGAFGIANMWMAVFADVGVAVLAILNSMRALGFKETE